MNRKTGYSKLNKRLHCIKNDVTFYLHQANALVSVEAVGYGSMFDQYQIHQELGVQVTHLEVSLQTT